MKNTLLRDILVAFILLVPYSTYSQTNDGHIEEGSQKLFARFEQRFGVLDSLIFLTPTPDIANGTNPYSTLSNDQFIVDSNSLIDKQVDAEIRAMKHQTGLSMTGQTYYRMDEGLALDADDAVSRYQGKVQVELRWNVFNSSLLHRKGKINALELSGQMARVGLEKSHITQLITAYEEYYRTQYDSLLSGILQHRLENLTLMNEAQMYLLEHGNISSDDMLTIINDKAEAERSLMAIGKTYPKADNLSNVEGVIIDIDSVALFAYVQSHCSDLMLLDLQSEMLAQKRDNESYWSHLDISPFVRYSYYFRTDLPNSTNVDVGVNFSIPLSGEFGKKRAAMDAERMVVEMKKQELEKKIKEDIRLILQNISRLNQTSITEMHRMSDLRKYLTIRSNAYQNRKGGYNIILRTKEYNTYLLCWEKFLHYQHERDKLITQLQLYLPDISVFDFCIAEHVTLK